MMSNEYKQLNIEELDNVSGGDSKLDKYLKTIAGKDKTLVDKGTGTILDLNPSVEPVDDGNLYIIKRDKEKPEIEADLFVK